MTKVQSDLITLLRHAVCGAALPEGFAVSDPEALYRLAHTHDLAHIVDQVLLDHALLDPKSEAGKHFAHDHMLAIWRVGVQERELRAVSDALSAAGIEHIPLKGSVLRARYPEPWMRTSSDTDVLVRECDLARAEQTLADALGFTSGTKGPHDHTLVSPSGMHLELHFTLSDETGAAAGILRTVWDTAAGVRVGAKELRMSDALLYYYHVFHAAYHIRRGNCGVRTVMDIWILNHRTDHDPEARRTLLRQGGLQRLAEALEAVAEAWFSGARLDPRRHDLEAFLFVGGVYRGKHNYAAEQARSGGRLRYVLRRAFPPRGTLRFAYPVLERRAWLLPACWAHRLGRELFSGRGAVARRELRLAKENRGFSRELSELFEGIGLL